MALDNTAFALDDEGNIIVETDPYGNKSFKLIDGIESMVQDIRLRLTTPKGELPMHPEVGFPINQVLGILNAPFTEAEAKRAVLLSPDVGDVTDAEAIILDGDGRRRIATVLLTVLSKDGVPATTEVSV